MKKIKIMLVMLTILICMTLTYPMAKRYPLPQNATNDASLANSYNGKITPDNVVQKGISLHGINLRSLPQKNEYKIGLIDTKKGLIIPVVRYTPAAEQLPHDATQRVIYAINELLKGPSKEEESKDYISLFPEGTKLERCEIIVDNFGVRVKLEFSEEILKDIDEIKNVLIQDQITYTLISLDIPKIYGVDVFVKGKPLGYYASGGK